MAKASLEERIRAVLLYLDAGKEPREIEYYHKALGNELISQVRFKSLSHFRRELAKFDRRYNYWRKSQALGWKTPASIYDDRRYLNKGAKNSAKE